MSVRMRTWTTGKGDVKEAWTANYTDQSGKRRMKTFARKQDADVFHDRTKVDVRAGVHTPDAASVTVAQAAEKWIRTCRDAWLERSNAMCTLVMGLITKWSGSLRDGKMGKNRREQRRAAGQQKRRAICLPKCR
jgi:hypothetical protein